MAFKRMKPARPPGAAPAGSQFLAALRRAADLIDEDRLEEARDHLENLHRQYPGRVEPLHLLLDVACIGGDLAEYDTLVPRLLKTEPVTPEIRLAQAAITFSVELFGLALERFERFAARWPEHKETPKARETVAFLKAELERSLDEAGLHGEDRFELAARNDEIQAYLTRGRYGEARSLVQALLDRGIKYPPALNNMAMACLLEGRPADALVYSRQVVEMEPENVYALAHLARSLHLLGCSEEAAAASERMKRSAAFAADKTGKLVETLSYLGDDAGVVEVYERALKDKEEPCLERPMLHHLAGAAAMRLGRETEARLYWRQALDLDPHFELTKANLADLNRPVGERHAPWPFSMNYWIHKDALSEMSERVGLWSASHPGAPPEAPVREYVQEHPSLETIVRMLLERGDSGGREFALMIAQSAKTPKMLEALGEFALSRNGPDSMRIEAASLAARAGILEQGEARLWIQGEEQEGVMQGWELHGDPMDPMPPHIEKLAREAVEATYRGDGNRAEKLLKQALKIDPDNPRLLNNLMNAYRTQRRDEEASELLFDIVSRFPDYFFGKVNLANYLLLYGQVEEAEDLLKPLLAQKRLHFSEFAALAQSQIELFLAKEDEESARKWYEMLKQTLPDHPGLSRRSDRFEKPGRTAPRAGRHKNLRAKRE